VPSRRRSPALAAAAAAALLLALPVAAGARERDVPSADTPVLASALEDMHDTVIQGETARAARIAAARAPARTYTTVDGYRVEIESSASYAVDPAADQGVVDFLASRVHGPELADLRVYVGTPPEIRRLCGGHPRVVACYSIADGRMFVPGEAVAGIPVEYPITHEYGHHVASWRSNNPWFALDWGAKYWSSAMRVCTLVQRGLLFPGNQGQHYREDPGEGFADGYAHLHYPDAPWYFSELMRPGAAELAAIRRDVLEPWTGPRSRTFRGRLGPSKTTRRFSIRVKLDGNLTMRLAAPARAAYEVAAQTDGYAAGRTLRPGGQFGIEWCRREPAEHVTLTVRRRKGSGPFALRVRWAG
jgi:hypothetical protein